MFDKMNRVGHRWKLARRAEFLVNFYWICFCVVALHQSSLSMWNDTTWGRLSFHIPWLGHWSLQTARDYWNWPIFHLKWKISGWPCPIVKRWVFPTATVEGNLTHPYLLELSVKVILATFGQAFTSRSLPPDTKRTFTNVVYYVLLALVPQKKRAIPRSNLQPPQSCSLFFFKNSRYEDDVLTTKLKFFFSQKNQNLYQNAIQ